MSGKGKKNSATPEILTPRLFYIVCMVIFLAFILAHNLMNEDAFLSVWSTERYSHIFLYDYEEHDEKMITTMVAQITIVGVLYLAGSNWLHIDSLNQRPTLPPPRPA